MEHNEYSVYKVRVSGTKRLGTFKDQEYVNLGETDFSDIKTVVAPSDEELAKLLMSHSLKRFSNDEGKLTFEIVEKQPLDCIIRFEDAYRARF